MNSRTQSFILLLFGGALLRLGSSDLLLRYVRPIARPWVLLAGAALVALAVLQLARTHRPVHAGPAVRTGWLVLAPVVAILVIGPPALGSYSAARTPVAVSATDQKDFAALIGPAPHPLALFDFTTRVLWDGGRTVTGQQVQLTGFVLGGRPGGFVLARLVITCCAADARPVEVEISSAARPAKDSWVQVSGRYAGLDPKRPGFPVLSATAVLVTAQPTDPYD